MSLEQGQDWRIMPLDSTKLQKSFQIETRWVVVTGAPSAGKTTLLRDIKTATDLEWHPEIARVYLERNTTHCKDEVERHHYVRSVLRANEGTFQRALIDEKISLEKSLSPQQVILFDRAMPDSITYYRAAGLNPNDALDDIFYHNYALVFILDPLPMEQDAIRTENELERDFLNVWLERDYRSLGYEVVRIPKGTREERLQKVLDLMNNANLC